MTRKLPMIAAISAMALVLPAAGTLAQSRLDQTQLADVRMVNGKVVDLEQRPQMVTMLKLDNGTSLTVPPEGTGPGERAQIGDTIIARYTDNGSEKVATLVRVIEMQAP